MCLQEQRCHWQLGQNNQVSVLVYCVHFSVVELISFQVPTIYKPIPKSGIALLYHVQHPTIDYIIVLKFYVMIENCYVSVSAQDKLVAIFYFCKNSFHSSARLRRQSRLAVDYKFL